ncbi:hypothetical protein [Citrobacter koseri]|nr:hypothetical protein [Citrobacter koseri]
MGTEHERIRPVLTGLLIALLMLLVMAGWPYLVRMISGYIAGYL